jgi:hypothetical protein
MMEEIRLDTSGLAAASTVFYSNKTLFAPLSPPRPPGKNNGSGPDNGNGSSNNRHRNNNRATAVVAARTATMVKTAVATPPATPLWFLTTLPPTTAGVPHHGRRL